VFWAHSYHQSSRSPLHISLQLWPLTLRVTDREDLQLWEGEPLPHSGKKPLPHSVSPSHNIPRDALHVFSIANKASPPPPPPPPPGERSTSTTFRSCPITELRRAPNHSRSSRNPPPAEECTTCLSVCVSVRPSLSLSPPSLRREEEGPHAPHIPEYVLELLALAIDVKVGLGIGRLMQGCHTASRRKA